MEIMEDYKSKSERIKELSNIGIDSSNRREYVRLKQELNELRTNLNKQYVENGYKPSFGDIRYSGFPDKALIDYIRVKNYELYGKDPSISFIGEPGPMFGDTTLYVIGNEYAIRGIVPYRLFVSTPEDSLYDSYNNPNSTILVRVTSDKLLNNESYAELITNLFLDCTGKPFNIVLTNGKLEYVSIARIADNEFSRKKDGKKDTYTFFSELHDNLLRNDIYIGNEILDDTSPEDYERLKKDFILRDRGIITRETQISEQKLNDYNEGIKRLFKIKD